MHKEDLYNTGMCRVKVKIFLLVTKRKIKNHRIKRELKRHKEKTMCLHKEEAKVEKENMLECEISKIEESFKNGGFNRQCLLDLIKKATSPFKHTKKNYTKYKQGNKTTCASTMSMATADTVLTNKRKADKLSQLQAKQRKIANKNVSQTPNTTRGQDGISTIFCLEQYDNMQEKTQRNMKRK